MSLDLVSHRVDLHSHTGHSSDSLLPAEVLLEAAVRAGLAAIAVTDHNSLGGALQACSLVERSPERFGNLVVIPGEEVKTVEGEIIGLFLCEPIPRGLTPEETIGRIRAQGGLVLVPHPFDRLRGSRIAAPALDRIAPLVDAIEVFNARTTLAADNTRALDFARRHHLAVVAGSDAHTAREVGFAYVEIDAPPAREPKAFLEQICAGRIGGRLSPPLVHFGSTFARWRKRLGIAPTVQL
ncbi:MAG: PHP domain-containing protein [Chloroflexi bacterium]|nr:PHP domain-containing protein [Chloroflexota bacterium]